MTNLNTNEILKQFGGAVTNCLDTVFTNLDDDETSPIITFTQKSSFLDPNDENIQEFLEKNRDYFTILSFNADSIHKKIQLPGNPCGITLTEKPFFLGNYHPRSKNYE